MFCIFWERHQQKFKSDLCIFWLILFFCIWLYLGSSSGSGQTLTMWVGSSSGSNSRSSSGQALTVQLESDKVYFRLGPDHQDMVRVRVMVRQGWPIQGFWQVDTIPTKAVLQFSVRYDTDTILETNVQPDTILENNFLPDMILIR